MKKLHQVLEHKSPTKGDVGIEIECEGRNLQLMDTKFWKTEDDGSLRGNFPDGRSEYVLKSPILEGQVEAALDEIILAQKEAKFDFSFRTSCHVHINCTDMIEDEFITMAYLYMTFEDVLIRFCGDSRRGNRFCLRVQDAEQQIDPLINIIDGGWQTVYHIGGDQYRYAAMNLAALAKYGSVEFRAMRGNMDKNVLLPWVTALLNLRRAALEFKTPIAVHEYLTKNGVANLFLKVFGNVADSFGYVGMEQEVLRCVSLAIEIPFLWKQARDRENKKPELKPYAPKMKKFNFEQAMVANVAPEAVAHQEAAERVLRGIRERFAIPDVLGGEGININDNPENNF
jgi:hypothetical protein